MKTLRAIWDLTRLEHGFIYGLGVIAGVFITLGYFDLKLSIFGFFTALFLQASAFALNDYFDYEVDLANKRFDRPLVRGDLSKNTAILLSGLFAVPGFIFAYLVSLLALVLAFGITFFGYLYDIKLKEYGVVGNIYIAFSMSAPFIFGSIVAGAPNIQIAILSVIAFLSGFGREIMKGIEDVEGDAIRDVKTIARIYGVKMAGILSAILYLISVILSFLVLLIPEYMDIKYIVPVLICDYLLIDASRRLLSGVRKEEIRDLRKKTMIALFFGLIAFILGAI